MASSNSILPLQPKSPDEKLLVHCLDGVEKSGVFLGAFNLLQKMRMEGVVDVVWSVSSAREANPRFIHGPKQFELLLGVAEIMAKKMAL